MLITATRQPLVDAMVTRKPVAPAVDTTQASSSSKNASPPYPVSHKDEEPKTASSVYSGDLNNSPAFDLIDMDEARQKKRRDSDVSSHGTWDSDGTERDDDQEDDGFVDVPKPLQISRSQQDIKAEASKENRQSELPSILRPGPANGAVGLVSKNESQEYEREARSNPWQLESNNPYHKQTGLVNGEAHRAAQNSQPIWQQPAYAAPPPPFQAPPLPPVELPATKSPTEEMAHMSLDNPPLATPSFKLAESLPVPNQGQPPLPPISQPHEAQALPVTNPWAENKSPSPPPPPKEPLAAEQHHNDVAPPPQAPLEYFPPPPASSASLIDHEEQPALPQQPPPITTPVPAASASTFVPETPRTQERKRSEHYQIKHINWQDRDKMRTSPVLTQNENGPCPLLALVNALVLSTPLDMDTALVETLRTREQVSLGLLLDAVFDELMSGRRGDTATQLPDVSELYSFLLALHTGMNVNPRFITPAQTPRGSYDGHPAATNGIHPVERAQKKPGCFEETREMRLYSTFSIPLLHGWIAPKGTPVYSAFERNAQSFEDAQNIQFAEPELEHKRQIEGLNFQEQQMLDDIQTIKVFLNNWPTQLTEDGLEAISSSLHAGQIAILFRNDHFSTLYKEPRHGALMTLVTDQGYSSHAEIVWESLVDVNGAAGEYFSGDFRSVSHGQVAHLNQSSSGGGNDGWQTVERRSPRPQAASSNMDEPPPLPGPRPNSTASLQPQRETDDTVQHKSSEQEDHDLALALQLQEEEEEQQRQAEARRRREQELSERYLSSEERPPAMPPRRNQRSPRQSSGNIPVSANPNTSGPRGRQAVNRPADSNNDPDAPPSYEQSSHDRPFRPAGATAQPAQGNPLNTLDALQRQSAFAQQSSATVNTFPGHNRRTSQGNRVQRRSSQVQQYSQQGAPGGQNPPGYPSNGRVNQAATVKDADERCVVM